VLAWLIFAPAAQAVRPSQGAQALRPVGTEGDLSGADAQGSLLQEAATLKQASHATVSGQDARSAEHLPSFDEIASHLDGQVAAAMHRRASAVLQHREIPSKPIATNPAAAGVAGEQRASPGTIVAPKEAPCTDAVAEVQASINCSIPPACTKYPPHSAVPEIQLGTQRVLEKCFEFHNACQATAHKFLEIKAMRKLLKAKIQMMKTEVEAANKQFHERIIRLVEKNQTIHMLYDGVKQINSTVESLNGSSVEFPGNDTHLPIGEPKLNDEEDDASAKSFR